MKLAMSALGGKRPFRLLVLGSALFGQLAASWGDPCQIPVICQPTKLRSCGTACIGSPHKALELAAQPETSPQVFICQKG